MTGKKIEQLIDELAKKVEDIHNRLIMVEYKLFGNSAKDRIDDIKERLPKIYLVDDDE